MTTVSKTSSPHQKRKNDDTSSASNKKRALKHERQSHRRHSDAVVASKEIWNRLRLKTNTREETSAMTNELMDILRGKFSEVAMQHDASRIVQAVIQYGTAQQRLEVVKEISDGGNMSELCKIQYAHFAVLKIIKYCFKQKDCVQIVVKVRTRPGTVFTSLRECTCSVSYTHLTLPTILLV